MRDFIINIMAFVAAKTVGWNRKAAKGLALTQRQEPLRNVPSNLWVWTHNDEWDEFAMSYIADHPEDFLGC